MAIIKRNELPGRIGDILSKGDFKVFLFFGERYLCRKAADELQNAILKKQPGTVYTVDGDQEDNSQTLSKLMSFSLLPGLQIYRINDTRLFLSKNISQTVWLKTCQAFKDGRTNPAAKYLADMYHSASISADDRQPPTEIADNQWEQLFGFSKPSDLGWADQLFEVLQQQPEQSSSTVDITEKYIQAFDKGLPPQNILFLLAENVDKRKRLFTHIKDQGIVVDCSVAEGAGAAVQKVQKSILQEIMQRTLAQFDKTIDNGAIDVFFERVGFHPVAVAMETEKLALYCSETPRITLKDINQMVGRSREDALFELTDYFSKRQVVQTLTTLHHLLEDGIHGLAILATLRNYIRKLLIFRTIQLQPEPAYQKGMAVKYFQDNYLPQLKAKGEWKDLLKGHPYALFMSFSKAAEFQCATLKNWLERILDTEFRLKGSGLTERLVLEQLLISMLSSRDSITSSRPSV